MARPALLVRMAASAILLTVSTRLTEAQGLCRPIDIPGAINVSAYGTNNGGDVVGYYTTSSAQYGFVRHADGQITTITNQWNTFTIATGINDAGDVVGYLGAVPVCHCVDDIQMHGFKIVNGVMTTFDIGAAETLPMAINSFGQIVGSYHDRWGDVEDAPRGFLMTAGGAVAYIDAPGGGHLSQVSTEPTGINNAGKVAGAWNDTHHTFLFTWLNGQLTSLPIPPGASWANSGSINTVERIVGTYSANAPEVGFIRSGRRFSDFTCAGTDRTYLTGLNDKGAMAGNYMIGSSLHAFYTLPLTFVDPVPDLVQGAVLKSNGDLLATQGRQVQGAAADGVTVLLLRVPTANVGDQVTLTLLKSDNDNDPATNVDEYGALGTPGSPCCQFNITVTSGMTVQGPMAFATYRAPADFPRPGGVDVNASSRKVFIRYQVTGGSDSRIPLILIRPFVAAVHGMWGDASAWDDFTPLIGGMNGMFGIKRVNYNDSLGAIVSTDPSYPSLSKALANSLGFKFNAPVVLGRIERALENFKTGENPIRSAVAAVQADIVVHSMGGDISRMMVLEPAYTRNRFGKGIIHKLITIDTPHLGTPIAYHLIATDENNRCLRWGLASEGNYAFRSVSLTGGAPIPGAVGDLSPGSAALNEISASNPYPIQAATVVGEYTNWSGIQGTWFQSTCRAFGGLAASLTAAGWPALFIDDLSHRNDVMVSVNSQNNNGTTSFGPPGSVIHSTALQKLGFVGNSVLSSASTVPNIVLNLLNQPITDQTVFQPMKP